MNLYLIIFHNIFEMASTLEICESVGNEDLPITHVCVNKKRKGAPNRLLNMDAFRGLIEPELKECSRCLGKNRFLSDGDTIGIDIGVIITCLDCDLTDRGLRRKIANERLKLKGYADTTPEEKVKRTRQVKKILHLTTKVSCVRKL